MTTTATTVIAGSQGFALALLAPLAARMGTRPAVTGDASQALGVCGPGGLVVVEFQGEGSLRGIRELLQQGDGVRVVAALREAHASAEGPLRALGVEVARWNEGPRGVLGAVARRLAAPVAPRGTGAPLAPRVPSPVAPPTAPARADATGAPWPAGVPGPVEAADALGRGLAGATEPRGLSIDVVGDVLANLSDLERAVLSGAPQPVDADPVRRAAVMRVRVAVALATAPPLGGAVDAGAVSALLAEIDGLLSDVGALAAGATPELQRSLEAVRNSLVREAIDFSEAVQRAAPAGEAPEAPNAVPAPRRRPPRTRLVAAPSRAERELVVARGRRQRRIVLVLAVAAIAAAAFHGYGYWKRQRLAGQATTRASAPPGALVVAGPTGKEPVVVRSKDGKAFGDEGLKRLRDAEVAKGNTVHEVAPGVVLILPASPGDPAPAPGR